MRWEILEAFGAAAESAGIPPSADFNSGDNFGAGYFQVNQKNGRRWSAARGFLKPALKRPNLKLETGAHVIKLIFDGKKCVGVRYRKGGDIFDARTEGEIVLSAGAVATPKILELSGIGDRDRLKELDVDIVRHSPGVGENLQDHLQLRPIFKVSGVPTMNALYQSFWRRPLMALEYTALRKGPLSMAPSQFGAFAYSSKNQARPNLQFHVQPLSLDKFGEPLHAFPAMTISVCNLRPTSRGSVHARNRDPDAPPAIRPNYLSTPEDERVAVEELKLVREITRQPALARYHPEEYGPSAGADSDAELLAAARAIGTTIFHPVGTAKMGVADDAMAVVDSRLRVFSVSGLRIADASVMPRITSGNTNSPTMMIAGKAAAMMLEDAKKSAAAP
jgi:choline dehydrogenase-like flavoprotein